MFLCFSVSSLFGLFLQGSRQGSFCSYRGFLLQFWRRYGEKHTDSHTLTFLSNGFSGSFYCNLQHLTGVSLCCYFPLRALADMNKDGKMDRLEFSIAMKLIKLKLQGTPLPSGLPIIMKQPPVPAPSLNNPTSLLTNPAYGTLLSLPIHNVKMCNLLEQSKP